MAKSSVRSEALAEPTLPMFQAADPDLQRGRKRRRSPPSLGLAPAQVPSGDSAVFRGRCKDRSTSRPGGSINTSRLRAASPSPSYRKIMRIIAQNGHQNPNPDQPGSAPARGASKRQRPEYGGRSRFEDEVLSSNSMMTPSLLHHEIVVGQDESMDLDQQDIGHFHQDMVLA